jgi:SAM-dependent methyltransferase
MVVKPLLARALKKAAVALETETIVVEPVERTCTICDYVGPFRRTGAHARSDGSCPNCKSMERHRQLKLMLDRLEMTDLGRTLHFAPESWLVEILRERSDEYVKTDYIRDDVDLKLNIEELDLDNESFDTVLCSHVLEHVDDRKALAELYRVLRPGGLAILAVPIIEGWDTTYEDPSITTARGRRINFGQDDHVRVYGRDFRDRVRAAGFTLSEFSADGADTVKYGLSRGARIFLAQKPRPKPNVRA